MDGFAVRSSDVRLAGSGGITLPVVQHIAAGQAGAEAIDDGTAARIMTGAPLPVGADAVIPFEEVTDNGDSIEVFGPVLAGACVRPAGQDIAAGEVVLKPGTVIGSTQIALLAAVGCALPEVTRRPIVAVLATGDELVSPGSPLGPGQIYNSNTPMLAAAILEAGAVPRLLEVAKDDPVELAAAVATAHGADLLLTTGGASVGDFDFVKDVIGAEGDLAFWRVRVRPGKPILFGSVGHLPVIGLPGNPTSAMVTFEQFVRPAIRTMLGAAELRPEIEVVVDERIDNRGGRRTYARVRLEQRDGEFHAVLSGPQDSAMTLPLSRADGLLVVPEDRDELLPGERAVVQVWRLQ